MYIVHREKSFGRWPLFLWFHRIGKFNFIGKFRFTNLRFLAFQRSSSCLLLLCFERFHYVDLSHLAMSSEAVQRRILPSSASALSIPQPHGLIWQTVNYDVISERNNEKPQTVVTKKDNSQFQVSADAPSHSRVRKLVSTTNGKKKFLSHLTVSSLQILWKPSTHSQSFFGVWRCIRLGRKFATFLNAPLFFKFYYPTLRGERSRILARMKYTGYL